MHKTCEEKKIRKFKSESPFVLCGCIILCSSIAHSTNEMISSWSMARRVETILWLGLWPKKRVEQCWDRTDQNRPAAVRPSDTRRAWSRDSTHHRFFVLDYQKLMGKIEILPEWLYWPFNGIDQQVGQTRIYWGYDRVLSWVQKTINKSTCFIDFSFVWSPKWCVSTISNKGALIRKSIRKSQIILFWAMVGSSSSMSSMNLRAFIFSSTESQP